MPSLQLHGEYSGYWDRHKGKPEHPLDYLTRIGRAFTLVGSSKWFYYVNSNKSTKLTSRSNACSYPVTFLNECDDCGYRSTPRKVNYKYHISGYFCMSCSNKRHRIYRLECDALETRKITNKLGRIIRAKQKEPAQQNMP